MSNKTLSLSLGSVIAASISLAPVVQAAENPFAIQTLSAPSLVAEAGEKMKDGKCGEGKCSGKTKSETTATNADGKAKEGNCGANKMKEGGCSGSTKTEEAAPAKP
ncbi:hypothetical protein [Methylocaldum sp.]|jgi:uncharacterized low-complexity protein|uniref:hypothetical protein n=1 Tax=Methylocaldum sp. TaxID=1969727 RepID=UPI002D465FE3|nr:hypothetical protein [Methylocaldum sp.]HYE35687.1 hypothetical protein [Methylocaldum sp.]